MILEISIVSLLADMLDSTMLLPLITPQSACQPDNDPRRLDQLEARQSLRVPLRECHSIPDSLPRSFGQSVDKVASSSITERKMSKGDSKTVRFAPGGKSIQYFDPTERASCVHKNTTGIFHKA
ncbi:hypothetical protein BJY01DRAFT_228595 [Aspergillus pseudoustus]|uniref:Uncharacterized protein n=1 Tax=Aspergillus pseudoustus TaxID=1810923 RepID=A0ABR4IKN3_9EURO